MLLLAAAAGRLGLFAVVSAQLLDQSQCPNSAWSFSNGKCYLRTASEHTFDHCNRVVCPALANGTGASVLACVDGKATNGFIAGALGGDGEATWVGLYQRRKDGADKGWNRQAAEGCESTYAPWRPHEPNDWAGCSEDCAVMGLEGDDMGTQGKRWVDIDCAYEATCACEYPAQLSATYSTPKEVKWRKCAWVRIYWALLWASLVLFVFAAALVARVLRVGPGARRGEPAAAEAEAANPMIGLLPGVEASYVAVASGFEGSGSGEVNKLCAIVLQLIVGFTTLNVLWRAVSWAVIYAYGVEPWLGTLIFSVLGLVFTLFAAWLGIRGVQTRNGRGFHDACACACTYIQGFGICNWLLVAIYSISFVMSLITIAWNRAYHELVTNFIFAGGYGTIAHYTSKLLEAISKLDRPASSARVELPAVAAAEELPVVVGTVMEGSPEAGETAVAALEVRPQEAVLPARGV